jgi:hypothetical protein
MAKTDPAAVPAAPIDSSAEIEIWFADLLASLPLLRKTENYNRLRTAVDDLKSRLQPAAPTNPIV